MAYVTQEQGWVPEDSLALRLVMARFQAGDISQKEAAERCGLKPSTWATWEHGTRPRGLETIAKAIEAGLGVNAGWLVFGGPLHSKGDPEPTSPTPHNMPTEVPEMPCRCTARAPELTLIAA